MEFHDLHVGDQSFETDFSLFVSENASKVKNLTLASLHITVI